MLPAIVALLMAGLPLQFSELVAPPDPREIWLDALQKCENENHVKKILDSNNKFSYGDFMFQMDTWLMYGKKFGATRDNIASSSLQRIVARNMLNKDGWRHWFICGKIVQKSFGQYPSSLNSKAVQKVYGDYE